MLACKRRGVREIDRRDRSAERDPEGKWQFFRREPGPTVQFLPGSA